MFRLIAQWGAHRSDADGGDDQKLAGTRYYAPVYLSANIPSGIEQGELLRRRYAGRVN
ncbi:MAG TPA: hypothetical protein VNG51_01645 [Ktedonobacteraceae bacterium]|nr:hypothetical protein [Ktedonobacteraceae bacterium]